MGAGVGRARGRLGNGSEPLPGRRREPGAVPSLPLESPGRGPDCGNAAREVVAAAEATIAEVGVGVVLIGRAWKAVAVRARQRSIVTSPPFRLFPLGPSRVARAGSLGGRLGVKSKRAKVFAGLCSLLGCRVGRPQLAVRLLNRQVRQLIGYFVALKVHVARDPGDTNSEPKVRAEGLAGAGAWVSRVLDGGLVVGKDVETERCCRGMKAAAPAQGLLRRYR